MAVLVVLAFICAVTIGVLARNSYRLFSILTGTKHAEIGFSPHKLRFGEVTSAIFMMIIKPPFSLVLGSNMGSNTNKKPDTLTLSSPFCITEEDIACFHHAVGVPQESPSDMASLMLPLFLSAVTEPAMLLLLTHPRCPVNALGAVNVRNRFELLRPDLCQLHHFTKSHTAGLVASLSKDSRFVKRGIEYDLEVAIMVPDPARTRGMELVPVFRQIFTMLEFRRTKVAADEKLANKKEVVTQAQISGTQPLRISLLDDDPSKWAALCKDYNFIHFSGLAAKLFGLPGRLAHGNHVVSKAVHQLVSENKLQRLGKSSSLMEVHFRRPVVIPDVLEVDIRPTSNIAQGFSISSHGRTCIVAEYSTLEAHEALSDSS
jgi:acyl dehydratase